MQDAPVILALETSLGACSVAVLKGGVIAAEAEELTPGSQSRQLIPMTEAVLKKADTTYKDLSAVACSLGPGGFTGIRVGLAAARAMALSLGVTLIGLSTLEIIAFGAGAEGDILAVIDAYRGQYYAQRFRVLGCPQAQSDALLVDRSQLTALGHGARTCQTLPHARYAALLAGQKWQAGERQFPTAPIYIRAPDAKLPAKQGLKCAGESL